MLKWLSNKIHARRRDRFRFGHRRNQSAWDRPDGISILGTMLVRDHTRERKLP